MSESAVAKSLTDPTTNSVPASLDCSKAAIGVWLVKVPKYLAEKWNTAPDNAEVGRIRITQSKGSAKEVSFHLNETLGQHVNIKIGGKSIEHKIPLEHKFVTTPLGSQNVYILKQTEENAKDALTIIGKVMQRAECTPVQNDSNYIQLKREITKQFTEPKRQIKMVTDNFTQRHHFIPKSTHLQNLEKKDKNVKRIKKEEEEVRNILFTAFTKQQFYNIKQLEKITRQPTGHLKDVLHKICNYNGKGSNKNTWELKEEFKQVNYNLDSKKTAGTATSSLSDKKEESKEDYMEEDDDDDMDDSDISEDDDMIETI